MTNRLIPLIAVAFAACTPTTAEVRCGTSDCGANQRCEPVTRVCVLDEPPELVVSTPRRGALVSGDTLTVEGTVRDDNGRATLELSLDGAKWFAVEHAGVSFSAKVGLPVLDGQEQKILLRARDGRDQAKTVEVLIRVDNVAPQLSVGAPLEGAPLGLAWFEGEPRVHGRVSDGSGLTAFTIDVGDGPMVVTPMGGAFAWTWPAPAGEDGVPHAVTVRAVDLAGNVAEVVRAVTVDVVAPQVSFASPAEEALLGPAFFSGGGLVRGTVSPGARVLVELGHTPVPAAVLKGAWSVTYRPAALDFVPQKLVATAVDAVGNTTRTERVVVVDVVAPRLAFTGNLQGARLNAASFPQGNDVVADWSVADGDAQVDVKSGGAMAANPLRIATSPTDNPKAYVAALNAEDRAGNTAQAVVSFEVDRLLPTIVSRYPDPGTRHASTEGSMTFSEPMTGGPGLALTPQAGTGAWINPTRYSVSGLPHDTVFSANAGPVTDLFGNPVAPQPPTQFRTKVAPPALNTTLIADVARFEVSVDADGVFHFFTTSPTTPAAYRWTRVHPKTGQMEDHTPASAPTLGVAFKKMQVFSSARANADLTSRRIAAATTLLEGAITERKGWTRFDDQTANVDLGIVGVVPAPALNGEGAFLGEVGYLKHALGAVVYARAGKADLTTGLSDLTAMGTAQTRWEVVQAAGSALKRRSYQCTPGTGGFPASCGFGPIAQFNDLGAPETLTVAIGEHCSMYAYQTTTGGWIMRVEATGCAGKACVPTSWSWTASSDADLRVAGDGLDTFAWTQRGASGVSLYRQTLTSNCQGLEIPAGQFPVPVWADHKPVVVRGAAALVWVDGTNLKVSQ